jgi:hypothetical protein
MRRSLLTLSLLSAVAISPLLAHASEIITIDVTSGPNLGTWTLTVPSGVLAPPVVDTANGDFQLNNVAVTGPGGISTSDSVFFYDISASGGLWDPTHTALNFESGTVTGNPATFVPIAMFSGTVSAPSFVPGSGTITYDGGATGFGYTVADVTTPTPPTGLTPEPSSLMLLGTGALAVAGSFRRRILGQA